MTATNGERFELPIFRRGAIKVLLRQGDGSFVLTNWSEVDEDDKRIFLAFDKTAIYLIDAGLTLPNPTRSYDIFEIMKYLKKRDYVPSSDMVIRSPAQTYQRSLGIDNRF